MNPSSNGRGILAAQYFLYFGVMGMHLPFFNLYCYQLGFSGWQIGTLSAARSVTMIIFSIGWSVLADRFQARRGIYIGCNFVSAACWALFLFTTDFFWMLAIIVLYGMFYAPLIAFLEAFAMQALGRDKKKYGRMRAWGSLAFIISVLILGRTIDAFGIKIILTLILAASWAQALVSLGFPKTAQRSRSLSTAYWRQLLKARVVIFQICAFLMLVSHGAYYTFFSIHLANLKFGTFFIGGCWAMAVGAEIMAMYFSERIFKRFRYETVLMVSFGVAVARWCGLWAVQSAGAILMLQLLHAITYGTFHMASILYIDLLTPSEAKTLGQAVNNAATYGLGLMAGFFLSGALYQRLGAPGLFGLSAAVALLGGIIFAGYTFARGKNRLKAEG
ncbi:MAG: MFS transporter [Desulfobacteraceae bacterium]|nr:MFS transporter [Desulfobacteraceae bacterium]